MKKLSVILILGILFTSAFALEVQNATASYNNGKITIKYDLADLATGVLTCDVSVAVSTDNAVTFNYYPVLVSGDIGPAVSAGTNKTIVWDVKTEAVPPGSGYRFKVIARENLSTVPGEDTSFKLVEGGTITGDDYNITVDSFLMDKFLLTQSEYEAVMGVNPVTVDTYGKGDNFPVYHVTWFDAIEYCNRRSMQEGVEPCYSYDTYGTNLTNWPTNWNNVGNQGKIFCDFSKNGYRLPKEDEWIFAARSGLANDKFSHSGSDTVGDVAWYQGNSGSGGGPQLTHIVGGKAPNSLGIYDLSGNVAEWCWEMIVVDVLQTDGSYIQQTHRIRHGGAFNKSAEECAIATITTKAPTSKDKDSGFRIVKTAVATPY